jgi:hypothetical protein
MKTKKSIMAILIICSFLFITWLPCQADDVLCGCAKIKKGTLRVIDCNSQCLKSEYAVTLSGSSQQQQSMTLQCITGALYYTISDPLNYCNDPYSLNITNPYPSSSNPTDIFQVFCESPSTLGDDEIVTWGLRCKEGWQNTGCTGNSYTSDGDMDVPQFLNGCHSDDEEYGNSEIFTTCCRITAQ